MIKGIVYKSTGNSYLVKSVVENKIYECIARGKLRLLNIKHTNPISVGDYVEFTKSKEQDNGEIVKIFPRKNYIIRRSVNLSKETHILASNLDQAILVITLKSPRTYHEFIDRFLITSNAYQIPTVIVFSKSDTYLKEELEEIEMVRKIYTNLKINCLLISCHKKKDISKILDLIKNKTTLFSGNSGVGKSTLINYLNPKLNLKTQSVSKSTNKGQHTTTFAQMYDIDKNTRVIDSPGIKGFGLVDMKKDEIYRYFPELLEASKECRFKNCIHVDEPECEVKKRLVTGEISNYRYESYINLIHDKKTIR